MNNLRWRHTYWNAKDGAIKIKDMDTNHLQNSYDSIKESTLTPMERDILGARDMSYIRHCINLELELRQDEQAMLILDVIGKYL